jgi:hypothetical protein
MRKIVAIVTVLAFLWGGWWFVGSTAVNRGVAAWAGAMRDRGWTVDYSALKTRGFPSRFDTTIDDILLRDPGSGLGWSAPFAQILALSYTPHHVIVVLPRAQTVTTPAGDVDVSSDDFRASFVFEPSLSPTLDRMSVVATGLVLKAGGAALRAEEARVATRVAPVVANTHEVGVALLGLRLPEALRQAVDPDGTLPAGPERLGLDAMLTFDAPLDRAAVQGRRPQLTSVALVDSQVSWGSMGATAAGTLVVDGAGRPEGRIDVVVTDWGRMLDVAIAGGLVPETVAPTAARLLSIMASGGDTLKVPLTFADGRMALGPIPLGPAPRLLTD